MKFGYSQRDGGIDLTPIAKGFHEGLFVNYGQLCFGISSENRLKANGNNARPTKISHSVLEYMANLDIDRLMDIITVKYAGTPVFYKDNPSTPRQFQKNHFIQTVFYDYSVICECFGGGVFGVNDPIGLGNKFSNLLINTIVCISLNMKVRPFIKLWNWNGQNYKVIVSNPRRITEKQAIMIHNRLIQLLQENVLTSEPCFLD